MTSTVPASMGEPLSERPRNQHCMNCGDTRGGPVGHETSECTYVPTRRGSKPDLAAAVARHNEQLSPEDRAAVKAHAARILERERRVDQLAAAIGITKRSASEHTGREAEIRTRLDAIRIRLIAATEGPWEAGPPSTYGDDAAVTKADGSYLALCPDCGTRGGMDSSDAVLVAHSPGDLKFLLDLAGALEGQLATAEKELEQQRWYGEQLQMSVEGCSGNHDDALGLDGGGSDE